MRNFKKRRYIALGIFLLLFLSNITVFFNSEKNRIDLDSKEYSLPKLSDQEITIVTPINKTYIEPMSGYYLSTFGFENDADGTSPEGWVNQDAHLCTSQIISGLDGHNKILQQNDSNNGLAAVIKRTLTSPQDHGTIEYYVRTSVMTGGAKMSWWLWSPSGFEMWIVMGDSKITYFDGAIWQDIIPSGLTANTWYHFSVRWRSTGAPAYEGLNEGEWKIFIDEVEYGDYALIHDNNMTSVNLETGAAPFWFKVYWDAIGFDWENGYDIGDNLNEGLLLSFENTTTLDWMGYSLDGQANRTILGNTTIQMPDDGLHTIQVFGNNSLGTIYQSDVRHFSVDTGSPEITILTPSQDEFFGMVPPNFEISILKPNISKIWYTLDSGITNVTSVGLTGTIDQIEWEKKGGGPVTIGFYANDTLGFEGYTEVTVNKKINIHSPENKTYIEPMSGYYPATYGFENDENGNIPSEWLGVNIPGTTTTVVGSHNEHNKVLKFNDTTAFQETSAHNYFDPQSYGTVEYWWLASDIAGNVFSFTLRDSPGPWSLLVGILNDFIYYYDGTNHNIVPASSNQWYHIRIDFRCTGAAPYHGLNENRFFVHINGTRYGEYNFVNPSTQINLSSFGVGTASRMTAYVDAVGYSWDPNYNIGDNSYEGLLLSFENTTVLDWMGYSLDSQANLTILGNSTIPMPEDGFHSIQMFGNDSVGTIYQSDIQPFSVDTEPPEITITSPSQNQFFGSAAPNFAISIVEPNLNTTWYTLDGGITNITSVGLTGTINQTEWNKIVADSVTIRFYANDTYGFEGYAEVVIKKDLNPPQSSISQEGLTFTITADDGLGSGVAVIRYKINGSAWIDYTGPFSLDYGNYNITYQAIDAVGNVEGERTLIIKLGEPPIEEEPPDTMMFIIAASIIGGIGLVIVITIIIIRKRK